MGRWTKERHAQEAAKKAVKAAQDAEANPEQVEQVAPEPKDKPLPAQSRGNERDDAMEELVARRAQELTPQPEAEVKADPEPAAPAPEAAQVEAEAKPEPEVTEAPKAIKVKVDGEELEVTQAEVDEAGGIRALQTQMAAERRLKKSGEALAEARRLQALLIEMATKQANPQKPEPTDDEFIQSKIDVIRYGTPEESAAAMREVLSRSKVDPRQITDNATNAAVVHMARTQASQQFKQEFADVASNPMLMKLASTVENERLAQLRAEQKNPVMVDWNDFYRRIGNEIRSVVRPSQPVAQETKGNPSPASEKEARKSSIVTLPTAGARAELPKEDKPQTREDILNEMRSGRPA